MKKYLLTAALVFGLSGCATIFKGSDQAVTFNSEPSGAEVYVDGKMIGVTPITAKLRKNTYDTLMIKKDGYQTQTGVLEKKYDGVALLNIFWDLSTTDFVSGAAFEYVPNTYMFSLKKEEVKTKK
jgi:hypothetical protein